MKAIVGVASGMFFALAMTFVFLAVFPERGHGWPVVFFGSWIGCIAVAIYCTTLRDSAIAVLGIDGVACFVAVAAISTRSVAPARIGLAPLAALSVLTILGIVFVFSATMLRASKKRESPSA
jgi:hypothetical protein